MQDSKMQDGKVYIFGMDGATFDLMDPLIQEGKLPNITSLMEKGCYGRLRSSNPDLSPPAWTSFMTGKRPGKHGILDFFCQKEGAYELEFLNASYRKGKALWELYSEQGRRVCVLNVPFTYPPSKVNGIMISGMDTPNVDSDFIYPPPVKEKLESRLGPYLLEKPDRNVHDRNIGQYLKNIYHVTDHRFATADFLVDEEPWDLFMVVFESTDRIQHTMWKFFDVNHPEYTPEQNRKYGSALFDTYMDLDDKIGRLCRKIPEDATVLLLSDHGFGPLYKGVRLEKWLHNQGYLTMTRKMKPTFVSRVKEELKNHLPENVKKALKTVLPDHSGEDPVLKLDHFDVETAKVFTVGGYGHLIVNLKGRQPLGVVEPGEEYTALCRTLIKELKALEDPDTGLKVIDEAQMRDEVYSEYGENTPDIIIRWAKGYYHIGEKELKFLVIRVKDDQLFTPHRWSGNHRPDGIFIMSGPQVSHDGEIHGARIIDLAPTLLHVSGMKVPEDMDGQVLEQVLTDAFKAENRVEYAKGFQDDTGKKVAYSGEESRQVRDRLRNLGYME